MTSNQINYWKLREEQRNHVQVEKETQRANKAKEKLTKYQTDQNYQLGILNLNETQRANKAKETETNRTNVANEQIKVRTNEINQQNADTNQFNALTNLKAVNETAAHNRATEQLGIATLNETHRANTAKETAQNFSNYTEARYKEAAANSQNANADATYANLELRKQELEQEAERINELIRHNQATEEETKRYNSVQAELKDIDQRIALRQLEINKYSAFTNSINGIFRSASRYSY